MLIRIRIAEEIQAIQIPADIYQAPPMWQVLF